jgi:hypothetical protein
MADGRDHSFESAHSEYATMKYLFNPLESGICLNNIKFGLYLTDDASYPLRIMFREVIVVYFENDSKLVNKLARAGKM